MSVRIIALSLIAAIASGIMIASGSPAATDSKPAEPAMGPDAAEAEAAATGELETKTYALGHLKSNPLFRGRTLLPDQTGLLSKQVVPSGFLPGTLDPAHMGGQSFSVDLFVEEVLEQLDPKSEFTLDKSRWSELGLLTVRAEAHVIGALDQFVEFLEERVCVSVKVSIWEVSDSLAKTDSSDKTLLAHLAAPEGAVMSTEPNTFGTRVRGVFVKDSYDASETDAGPNADWEKHDSEFLKRKLLTRSVEGAGESWALQYFQVSATSGLLCGVHTSSELINARDQRALGVTYTAHDVTCFRRPFILPVRSGKASLSGDALGRMIQFEVSAPASKVLAGSIGESTSFFAVNTSPFIRRRSFAGADAWLTQLDFSREESGHALFESNSFAMHDAIYLDESTHEERYADPPITEMFLEHYASRLESAEWVELYPWVFVFADSDSLAAGIPADVQASMKDYASSHSSFRLKVYQLSPSQLESEALSSLLMQSPSAQSLPNAESYLLLSSDEITMFNEHDLIGISRLTFSSVMRHSRESALGVEATTDTYVPLGTMLMLETINQAKGKVHCRLLWASADTANAQRHETLMLNESGDVIREDITQSRSMVRGQTALAIGEQAYFLTTQGSHAYLIELKRLGE